MLVGQAVEATTGHDFDGEGIADPRQLGSHARGFTNHDLPGLLSEGAIEPELPGLIPYGFEKFLGGGPGRRRDDGAAIITDNIHGNALGPASAIEVLAESLIGLFGLFIGIGPDKPVKNLTEGERQVIDVFGQHQIDLGEQLFGRSSRRPRRKTADSRSGPLGATKENVVGHK
jgi:hypothetical protein